MSDVSEKGVLECLCNSCRLCNQ